MVGCNGWCNGCNGCNGWFDQPLQPTIAIDHLKRQAPKSYKSTYICKGTSRPIIHNRENTTHNNENTIHNNMGIFTGICIRMHIGISEVGGREFAFRQAPLVNGKSVRVVHAYARKKCQVEMHPKCRARPLPPFVPLGFPFSLVR